MFRTEREMVELLMSCLCNLDLSIEKENWEYIKHFEELDLGHGVADIVIAHYNNFQDIRNRVLSKFEIEIFMVLERDRNWQTIDSIQFRTKANLSRIRSALKRLVEEGLIRERNSQFRFYRKYKSAVTTSIAIEAKLSNWKRALKQAHRYNWFSHYSYVILPKNKIGPAYNNVALFKEMKVGLASIDISGAIEIIYTPKRSKPYNKSMSYMLNESLLGNWLEETQPRS